MSSSTQDFDACLAARYADIAELTAALVELQTENSTLRRNFQQLQGSLPVLLEAARHEALRESDARSISHASVVAGLHAELVAAHEALQSRDSRAGPNLGDMGAALTAAHTACASLLAETDDLKAQLAACRQERDATERAERAARQSSLRVSQGEARQSTAATPHPAELPRVTRLSAAAEAARAQDAVSPLGAAAAAARAAFRAQLDEEEEPPEASALRAFSRHAKR